MANPSMVKHKIVLVPFPFDDLSGLKVRPAVCLTDSIGDFNHIIIAFISSKIPVEILPSDLIIRKEDGEFDQTGLLKDSLIRLPKMVTLPMTLIKREIGVLGKGQIRKMNVKIKELFD
jgi:mRNA interferase MazF